MFANESIVVESGAVIKSLIENECHLRDAGYDLYKCTTEEQDKSHLDFAYIMGYYNEQYGLSSADGHFARHPRDLAKYVMNKWNVYMLSLGELAMTKAKVEGPRIGLCANAIEIQDSDIEASGHGCQHDGGLGKGLKSGDCAASGAAHGGRGGYGATETLRENEIYAAGCEGHRPEPYYFGHEARYEGSGGGSGDPEEGTGGSGGGVVWLTTPGTLHLEGTSVAANGKEGEVSGPDPAGSGGGAGGSV